jgi:predicted KAP-like P-loop ATPase
VNLLDKLTISNLAKGALVEQFEGELEKVLDNIVDPNTAAMKVRKITITLEIKPNEHRNMADIKFHTKSSLIPANAVSTAILINKDTSGNVEAAELGQEVFGQMKLDEKGEIKEAGNVVSYVRNK